MESYASQCSVSGRPKHNERDLELLKAATNFDGEMYEVGLLWKTSKPRLPNNYSSALSQMKCLERRLEKDPQLEKRYQETIDVDVEKEFMRILDEVELENTKTAMVCSALPGDQPWTNLTLLDEFATLLQSSEAFLWKITWWPDLIYCKLSLDLYSDSRKRKLLWEQSLMRCFS